MHNIQRSSLFWSIPSLLLQLLRLCCFPKRCHERDEIDCFNKDYTTQTTPSTLGNNATKLKWHVYLVSADFTQARSGCLLVFFYVRVFVSSPFGIVAPSPHESVFDIQKASSLFTLLNNWKSSAFFFSPLPRKPHEEPWVISYPILEANQIVKLVKVQTLRLK